MPTDAPPVVTLFGPALDVGPPVPAGGPTGEPPVDRLASLAADAGGAALERRTREPLPWEARLMIALGSLPADVDTRAARCAVPLAALVGAADLPGGEAASASGRRVVADFVSFSPGRDEATLAPTESLGLSVAESTALAAAANDLLAADGIAFVRGRSGRWYLEGMAAAGLETAPAHFLARREIGAQWPGSAAAAPWRQLMAEIEMLWHAHPVNEAREARGAPPVNGVWFWGGAELPSAIRADDAAVPTVLAVDPVARALAAHAGAIVLPPATTLDEALDACEDDALLVVELGPYTAWLGNDGDALDAARASGLTQVVQPAIAAVAAGRASAFALVGDAGEASVGSPPPRGWMARWFGGRARRASS